jgi:hypothetical protein
MSFTDRLVLWLHIGFAIFTIGPVSAAIMSTPRYIRARNLTVVRYLYRTTRIFTLISLGVLVFGVVLGQQLGKLAEPWLTASMTLFAVAIVLQVIVLRDQRRAISALEVAAAADTAPAATAVPVGGQATEAPAPAAASASAAPTATAAPPATAQDGTPEAVDAAHAAGQPDPVQPATARQVATVERGRITTMGAVVTVIWLVILVLMVWK